MCCARFHEFQVGDDCPQGGGGRAAGLQIPKILLRLRQHEAVGAGQLAQPAAQQPLPGQRLRLAARRIGQGGMKAGDRRQVRRQIRIPPGRAHAQQRQRREQPADGGIGDQLPEEGLRVDRLVHQRGELLRLQEQKSLPLEEGQRIGPADRGEMRRVGCQPGGEFGGGGLGLLRFARVDDRDQQIAELGECLVHRHRPLPPRQTGREHQIGVGADPQMAGCEPAGEQCQQQGTKHHAPGVTAAGVDEANEEVCQHRFNLPSPRGRGRVLQKPPPQ